MPSFPQSSPTGDPARRARRSDWREEVSRSRPGIVLGVLVGGLMTGAGAWVPNSYWSSVLANLGTAVFLAIPLIAVERILARRLQEVQHQQQQDVARLEAGVADVEQSLARVSTELAQVARRTADKVEERRSQQHRDLVAPAQAIRTQPSYKTVSAALDLAQAQRLFLASPHTGSVLLHVVSLAEDTTTSLSKVHLATNPRGPIQVWVRLNSHPDQGAINHWWTSADDPETFFTELDDRLRTGMGALAPSIGPDFLLAHLASALEIALGRRANEGAQSSWALYALIGEEWVISPQGLEHANGGVVTPMKVLMAGLATPPDGPKHMPRGEWEKLWRMAQLLVKRDVFPSTTT